jgi:plasmid stabilization system protein ParE
MPRGDKSKYTDKQIRQADHIAEGYESRGLSETEAERRAWATVNKVSGGGKKSGSGRGRAPPGERSTSARKAAATRKRNAESSAH